MSMFDKAKQLAEQHGDKLKGGLDKAGEFVNEKTGGKYADQIEQGKRMADERLGEQGAPEQERPVTERPTPQDGYGERR